MHAPRLVVTAVALLAVASSGCATIYRSRVETVPKGSRVAVLTATPSGAAQPALPTSYLPTLFNNAQLQLVALHDVDASPKSSTVIATAAAPTPTPPTDDVFVASLHGLKQRLIDEKIDYVYLMSGWGLSVDRDFRGAVVRVSDLAIVSSTYLRERILGVVAGITLPLMGLGLLVLPWFALVDTEERTTQVFDAFIQFSVGNKAPVFPGGPLDVQLPKRSGN